MVQVDVVWSYAFGATLAAASARQLNREEKPFENKYYTYLLLFLSLFFAPAGLYLLWQFPHWETMQVASSRGDIPAWLVVIFAVTNITQGILGYWVTYKLVRKGRYYAGHVNWMVSWIIFWFILACGWDGTGWQRFLYDATMNNGVSWTPGTHMGLSFFTSNVFITLFVMGVFFTPPLVYAIINWQLQGLRKDTDIPDEKVPGRVKILLFTFPVMFGVCLGLAILAAVIVIQVGGLVGNIGVGYLIGLPVSGVAGYFLLFRKPMPMYQIAKQLFVKEPGE